MSQLIGIIIAFILGFVACWLFWRYQLILKPELLVSSKIASRPSGSDLQRKIYSIKIINLSKRPVINMKASLGVHELRMYERGHKRPTIYSVKLAPSSGTILGPCKKKIDPWSITNIHYYTAMPDKKLEELLGENRKIVFTIQATDATSNTTIIRRYIYNENDIVQGIFEPGSGIDIMPLNSIECTLTKRKS